MYEDCQAAVPLSKKNIICNRIKHISLCWSFVVERLSLAIGDITVVGISRTGMLADMFCSPRPASSFFSFCNTILGHPQIPIALQPTEERDASYSILVNAASDYPMVLYRAHTSIDMLYSCRIPLLCDCLSIWCEIWATKCLQGKFEIYWVYSFLPNSHIHRRA